MERFSESPLLYAFLDETGHSKDERQKFNGMAGLVAPAPYWIVLEMKWTKTLKDFHLPYFHMKDFAHGKRAFQGWSEEARQILYNRLLRHVKTARPLPIGSILFMEDYNSLTAAERAVFGDPYHIGFVTILIQLTALASETLLPGQKIVPVFSSQEEFKSNALKFYEILYRRKELRTWIDYPIFRDMRNCTPLQAADIVAYELYKEFERKLFRPNMVPRYGYQMIREMPQRLGQNLPMFAFQTKNSLNIGRAFSQPDIGEPYSRD